MITATRPGLALLLAFAVNAVSTQAPNISYSGPQTYTVDNAIPTLSPVNSGGSVPGRTITTLASGLSNPRGIAYDAAGNIYVAETNNNAIKKIPAGGGTPVAVGSGFKQPGDVAVDAAGNLYVADTQNDDVKEIKASDGSIVVLASFGFDDNPRALALDNAGNLYVATYFTGGLYKIAAGGGTAVLFAKGFKDVTGVAIDAAGNIYISELNNAIKKIPAGTNTPIILTHGFGGLSGVAVDAAGNVYFSDTSISTIDEIPAGGNTVVQLAGTLRAFSVSVTPSGVLYASDGANVKKIDNLAYNISPGLPAGLTFNTNTGVISGTPTAASPAANYTVTGTNASGSSTATINIAVNNPPAPAISYSGTQVFNVGKTVTPVLPTNSGGVVPGRGVSTLQGGLNGPIGLTYDAAGNVYVAVSGAGYPREIYAGGGNTPATPGAFSRPTGVALDTAGNLYIADNNMGQVTEENSTTNAYQVFNFEFSPPYSRNPYALALDAAGNLYVADNEQNTIIKLPATGSRTPTIIASGFSSPDGVAVDAAGNIYVADENNNAIKKIPVGTSTPVTIAQASGNPTGVAVDAAGNVYFTDTNNPSVAELPAGGGGVVQLGGGLTGPMGIAVTPAGAIYVSDGSAVKKIDNWGYNINPGLPAGLTFNTKTGAIAGTPTATSPATNYTITARNPGGVSSTTVNIAIHAGNANLSSIGSSVTPLTPFFAPNTISYIASVPYTTTSMTVKPVTSDASATVKVNGTTVASGSTSPAIALSVGSNTVNVVVTAPGGLVTKTYTITVTRAQSTNANLSTIAPSITPLSPYFAPNTTSYTLSVSNAKTSMTVAPVTSDANATLTVNGTAQASGATSAPIALAVGSNTISIVVTAPNGTTTKTYTITVTRASGGADEFVNDISVSESTNTVTLKEDGIKVHQGVSPNGDGIEDYLQIDNINQYPDNKLTIVSRNGQLVYEAAGYDNSSKVSMGTATKTVRCNCRAPIFTSWIIRLMESLSIKQVFWC